MSDSTPIIDVEILQIGHAVSQYQTLRNGKLRLEKILYPEETLPFDIAFLPKTLTLSGAPLRMAVFGELSHPPGTLLLARVIGAYQDGSIDPILLGVPEEDLHAAGIEQLNDLSTTLLDHFAQYMESSDQDHTGSNWLDDPRDVEPILRDAIANYRLATTENERRENARPAWQPINSVRREASFREADGYTDAEYTFYQLPYHFQYYVAQYLARDERILFAVHRPAIISQRGKNWLTRSKIQEGVLLLTNQRLLHLVELVPPGISGVRYGYHTQMGVLERLVKASTEPLGRESILLKTTWNVRSGLESLEWEFPQSTEAPLHALLGYLKNFTPEGASPLALLRGEAPSPPDPLPPLKDPAINDPQDLIPIQERFRECVPNLLLSGERIHAWALWPAWFENQNYLRVLVVTNRRVLIVPDPRADQSLFLDLALTDISSLTYVGSNMHSYIQLSIMEKGRARSLSLPFPYTSAAFTTCFDAMRRCMAVIPLHD